MKVCNSKRSSFSDRISVSEVRDSSFGLVREVVEELLHCEWVASVEEEVRKNSFRLRTERGTERRHSSTTTTYNYNSFKLCIRCDEKKKPVLKVCSNHY